jgi:hypothetical protein
MLRQLAVAQLVSRIHPYLFIYDTVVRQRKFNYTTLSYIVPFCLLICLRCTLRIIGFPRICRITFYFPKAGAPSSSIVWRSNCALYLFDICLLAYFLLLLSAAAFVIIR